MRVAMQDAARFQREFWLAALEAMPPPSDACGAMLHADMIRDLRRRLGFGTPIEVVRAQTRERVRRLRAKRAAG